MKIVKFKRTFQEGFQNFYRNGWLSFATILVLTISLYIIGLTLMTGTMINNAVIKKIEEKVNISIYFNPDVTDERILAIKSELEKYQEIKSVTFISKDASLEDFKRLSENDPVITDVLNELGENPLLASLEVKAMNPNQYEIISKAIDSSTFKEDVSHINYKKNKQTIDSVNQTIRTAQNLGIMFGVIFVLLAILITFNTIRITIYSHKSEFEIMRLVGASNIYVRMPYIFEGIFYGVFSSLLSFSFIVITYWYIIYLIKKSTPADLVAGSLGANFGVVFMVLLFSGVSLGVVSSFIAIRKYLMK